MKEEKEKEQLIIVVDGGDIVLTAQTRESAEKVAKDYRNDFNSDVKVMTRQEYTEQYVMKEENEKMPTYVPAAVNSEDKQVNQEQSKVEQNNNEELLKFIEANEHKIELGYCIGVIAVEWNGRSERVLMYDGFPCYAVIREIQEQITKEWEEWLSKASAGEAIKPQPEKLRGRVYELNDEYWENWPFGKENALLAAKEMIDEYNELNDTDSSE